MAKRKSDILEMEPAQAMQLAILCLEFEAENSPKRSTWRSECVQAVKVLQQTFKLDTSEVKNGR